VNLAELDLKALLVFDAVISERSTTKAGYRLSMSQPAVSSALNRLRHALKDELFIRGGDGMRPTPRALELAAPIRQALIQLREALDPMPISGFLEILNFPLLNTNYLLLLFLD
jgi:DNA-binding transcriptional LysR family regulator